MSSWFEGRRVAGILWPCTLLLIPKCPLCLLPLFAALGLGVPSGLAINVGIACIAAGWIWFVFSAASSVLLRAGSVVVAVFLLAGRLFSAIPPAATYATAGFMVVLGFFASRRCRGAGMKTSRRASWSCSIGGANHHVADGDANDLR